MYLYDWLLTNYSLLSNSSLIPLKEDENDFYNIFQRYQKAVLELGCSPCRIGGVLDSIAVCMV